MTDSLLCPNCGCAIEVSAVLASQLREHLRKELDADVQRKHAEFCERERQAQAREQKLENQKKNLDDEITRRLAKETSRLLQEAEAKAKEGFTLELDDLHGQVTETKRKLDAAQKTELQLRKTGVTWKNKRRNWNSRLQERWIKNAIRSARQRRMKS